MLLRSRAGKMWFRLDCSSCVRGKSLDLVYLSQRHIQGEVIKSAEQHQVFRNPQQPDKLLTRAQVHHNPSRLLSPGALWVTDDVCVDVFHVCMCGRFSTRLCYFDAVLDESRFLFFLSSTV